jgi:hypothetical protein
MKKSTKNQKPISKPTSEAIQRINNGLNEVYPPSSENDQFMFHDYFDERMRRAMEDPDCQEEVMRLVQFYG